MRLVEALVYTKLASRILAITLVVIVIGVTLFNLLKPVPPLAVVFNPDYGCGTIPAVKFPEEPKLDYSRANIEINTQEEALKFMPPIAYVYPVRYEGETLALRDRLFNIVSILGFNPDVYKNPQQYLLRWSDAERFMLADTRTGSFVFSFDRKKLLTLPKGRIVFLDDAVSVGEKGVEGLSLLEGYEGYEVKTSYYVFELDQANGAVQTRSVDSLAEASAVRTDFYGKKTLLVFDKRYFLPNYRRKMKLDQQINYVAFYSNRERIPDDYRVEYVARTVTDNAAVGNPSLYVHTDSGQLFKDQIAKIVYYNWDIEDLPCGTYPLRDVTSVFNAIQERRAYVAYLGIFGGDEVKDYTTVNLVRINLTEVELAYYASSSNWSEYLLPIYVVRGSAYDENDIRYDIVFYVDAILQREE